jgi:hypothetical protein
MLVIVVVRWYLRRLVQSTAKRGSSRQMFWQPAGSKPVDATSRTRLAIIEAYLELLRRNTRMPTAAQLATQAGCLVRSIFERFPDLDALRPATADYAIVQGQAESVARPCRR